MLSNFYGSVLYSKLATDIKNGQLTPQHLEAATKIMTNQAALNAAKLAVQTSKYTKITVIRSAFSSSGWFLYDFLTPICQFATIYSFRF